MTDISLTDEQKEGVRRTVDWFKNHSKEQQIWRVFGYAGVGKSTIVKQALLDMGISLIEPPKKGEEDLDGRDSVQPIAYAATYTGKASMVLRRKGTPARTIHSLIYSVSEATEEAVDKAKAEITKLQAEEQLARAAGDRDSFTLTVMIEDKIAKLKEMKRPKFGLNPDSPVKGAKLIVIDEASMAPEDMGYHLLSFGVPVLVLGDPGQLSPIKGEGFFTQATPDVMLTQIHRQAADSPIIKLATMARQGQWIDFGRYSDQVWKMRKNDVDRELLASADQVICGKNDTRLMLNNALRSLSGRSGEMPLPEDKIICIKNHNEAGLINGMFLTLSDIQRERADVMSCRIHDDLNQPVGIKRRDGEYERFSMYMGHFQDHVELERDRHDRDWKLKKGLVEATFGYAITCHKAQGSGWPVVAVWDDGLGRTREDRARWLYTAISRAEDGLLIVE